MVAILEADEELIQHVADRPGHDRRYAIDCAKLRALGWAPRVGVRRRAARDGRVVSRERAVVARDPGRQRLRRVRRRELRRPGRRVKGIILAGGAGTRLHPATLGISKQLLPVYDKPMVYYPLSTLMLAGIREILGDLDAARPAAVPAAARRRLAVRASRSATPSRTGRAGWPTRSSSGRTFIGGDSVALVLGDNIFHGEGLADILQAEVARLDGCTLFGYRVRDPERYGVAEAGADGVISASRRSPPQPRSNLRGDRPLLLRQRHRRHRRGPRAVARAARSRSPTPTTPTSRAGAPGSVELGRGHGVARHRHARLADRGGAVHPGAQHRQGVHIACLEEVAFRMGFIDAAALAELARRARRRRSTGGTSPSSRVERQRVPDLGQARGLPVAVAHERLAIRQSIPKFRVVVRERPLLRAVVVGASSL